MFKIGHCVAVRSNMDITGTVSGIDGDRVQVLIKPEPGQVWFRSSELIHWFDKPPSGLPQIIYERERQESLPYHRLGRGHMEWLTILSEEVGEAARAVCNLCVQPVATDTRIWRENLKTEIAQIGAVALAWLDDIELRERETAAKTIMSAQQRTMSSIEWDEMPVAPGKTKTGSHP